MLYKNPEAIKALSSEKIEFRLKVSLKVHDTVEDNRVVLEYFLHKKETT